MANKKTGPKLPKSVLDKVNGNKPKSLKKEPQTADEFLAQGIDDEESGDRWSSSDLLKSLRFYQRAYDGYLKCLQLDSNALDSYYNLSRLLFHVHNNFIKVEQIKLNTLENIDQCFGNVIQELPLILKYFEFVLQKFESLGRISWDLTFNAALIYQEFIEESDDLKLEQTLTIAEKSARLYTEYLTHQISELLEILKIDVENDNSNEISQNDEKEEMNEFEVITPALLLDTEISAYRLIQSVYESAATIDDIMVINTSLNDFLNFLKSKAEMIVATNYGEKFNSPLDLEAFEENKLELQRLDQFIKVFNLDNIKEVLAFLKEMESNNSTKFEFYLSGNDLLSNLISNSDPLGNGELYTLMTGFYKKAQDLLVKEFELINTKNDTYSSKISLILKIMISRSDIEYLRSKINTNENNKQILMKNTVNLLKNLINWTNKNGGLRENVTDQLNRMYLRKKASLRLSLLENGNIDGLLKDKTYWVSELQELQDLYHLPNFQLS